MSLSEHTEDVFTEYMCFANCLMHYLQTGKHNRDLIQNFNSTKIDQRVQLNCSGKLQCLYFLDEHKQLMYKLNNGSPRKVIYDREQRNQIIQTSHIDEHGQHIQSSPMIRNLLTKYFWKGLPDDIKKYVKDCTHCREKILIKKLRQNAVGKINNPNESILIDLDAKKNTFFEFQKFIECVLFYLRTGRHDKVLESSISPNRVRLCCSGKQKGSYYLDERGLLMHRVELGVSREVIYDVNIRDGILDAYHMEESGHNCILIMTKRIHKKFFWRGVKWDVINHIKKCQYCMERTTRYKLRCGLSNSCNMDESKMVVEASAIVRELTDTELADFTSKFSSVKSPDSMPKIYTRTGDKGTSATFTGARYPKDHEIFEAEGTVDELNCMLGMAREYCLEATSVECFNIAATIVDIQSILMDVGASIATPLSSATEAHISRTKFSNEHVKTLEDLIDKFTEKLPPLKAFILPSGGKPSCSLHQARALCRRAERRIVPLVRTGEMDNEPAIYLNRLSDYLFTAARMSAFTEHKPEMIYVHTTKKEVLQQQQQQQQQQPQTHQPPPPQHVPTN